MSYNSSTGVVTYTGPNLAEVQARIDNSAANVRAHFSGGYGITYASGTGVIETTNAEIQAQANLAIGNNTNIVLTCLLYTSPSPRDATLSRMPSSA